MTPVAYALVKDGVVLAVSVKPKEVFMDKTWEPLYLSDAEMRRKVLLDVQLIIAGAGCTTALEWIAQELKEQPK